MSLETYKNKRSFNKTPEPTGGKSTTNKLVFVVQKHYASHRHYDFRLEMRGTLKSWAVPKGPSMNPEDRRLAMLVEDHPLDYKDFEGVIPKGNYGAGTVIVWDEGTYEPPEKVKTKKEKEHLLLKGFYSGSLKITLHGKKLKGEFSLVRTPEKGETSWILLKQKDKYAGEEDITKKNKSVLSGKTLEELTGRDIESPKETPVIPLSPEDKKEYKNLLQEAEDAEEKKDCVRAIKLYKQQIKKHPDEEYAYGRLMIIYRKEKMYKQELELINQGIKFFQEYYEKKLNENIGNNSKIKQLSASLIKSLGLSDKKGTNLYEPEPIPKWKKRKLVVEKKLR